VLKFVPIIPSALLKFVNLFVSVSKNVIPEFTASHRLPFSSSKTELTELSANPSVKE